MLDVFRQWILKLITDGDVGFDIIRSSGSLQWMSFSDWYLNVQFCPFLSHNPIFLLSQWNLPNLFCHFSAGVSKVKHVFKLFVSVASMLCDEKSMHTFKWRPNTSLPKFWMRTPGMNWLLMLYYLNISGFFFFTFLRLLLFLNMNPLTLQQRARKLSKAFHGILFLLIYLKLSIFWSILCSLSMIL